MRLICLYVLLLPLIGYSQTKNQENSDFTIIGSVCIPKPISSKMFQTSFDGLYELNLSFNIKTSGNFYLGIGAQNVTFQNDQAFKYTYYGAGIPYNTRLLCNGVFARVNYDKFFSSKGYMSYSLHAGYMLCQYSNVNEDSSAANQPFVSTKFNAPFIQPQVSANFIVDKTLSFSVLLSYTTMFAYYDPKAPRFNQFNEISSQSNNYFMSWLNIGFGFNVLLDRKK